MPRVPYSLFLTPTCPSLCTPTAQVRSQLEAAQSALTEAKASKVEVQAQLAAKEAAVEALTTLSLRGDATVQEYMSNVKVGGWVGVLMRSGGCAGANWWLGDVEV